MQWNTISEITYLSCLAIVLLPDSAAPIVENNGQSKKH